MPNGTEDEHDPLEIPRCPVHPMTQLVDEGDAPDGSDARWVCPVSGCTTVRLA